MPWVERNSGQHWRARYRPQDSSVASEYSFTNQNYQYLTGEHTTPRFGLLPLGDLRSNDITKAPSTLHAGYRTPPSKASSACAAASSATPSKRADDPTTAPSALLIITAA